MSAAAPSQAAARPASQLARQALAEFVGTAALLCAVIGSGIMAEQLSGGNAALALLANTLATVFALYVLIETLGPVSGAHFNPLVTLLLGPPGLAPGGPRWRAVLAFVAAQLAGALLGAWLANAMFELPVLQTSTRQRAGPPFGWGPWLAEAVATASLLFVIVRSSAAGVQARASALVACTIGAAYWFTASTSFANPAAVFGRMFSDSFAGIAPASAPGFVLAQCLGAWGGFALARRLAPRN